MTPDARQPEPVRTLDYAAPQPSAGRSRALQAGTACCYLWPIGLVLAGYYNSPFIAFTAMTLAPAALVLGLAARHGETGANRRGAKFVVGFATFELVVMAAAALLMPTLGRATEPANRVKCAANLSSIYKASYMYANGHAGQFPPDLAQLVIDEDITSEVFCCPSSMEEKAHAPTTQEVVQLLRTTSLHHSYAYRAAGLTVLTASPQHVVAHDLPKNHRGKGGSVLFGDGSVQFVDAARLAYIIAELDAGYNPPRPAPAGR